MKRKFIYIIFLIIISFSITACQNSITNSFKGESNTSSSSKKDSSDKLAIVGDIKVNDPIQNEAARAAVNGYVALMNGDADEAGKYINATNGKADFEASVKAYHDGTKKHHTWGAEKISCVGARTINDNVVEVDLAYINLKFPVKVVCENKVWKVESLTALLSSLTNAIEKKKSGS